MNLYNTYDTKYGKITLYNNEMYIGDAFKKGVYWDEDTLIKLKDYIDPNKNILEIGGHCGTSSIVYSSYLNNNNKVFVYEPQKNMYDLLVKNINQNGLENKIISYNYGVFCYEGFSTMSNFDIDGGRGIVSNRYSNESDKPCNFGGISLGKNGEKINLTTIDNMNIDNIGFIHCDAQGSENFIFSKGIKTIEKNKPVILFEDNNGNYLYNTVLNSHLNFKEEGLFDVKKYCIQELKYSDCITNFNGSIDTLLIP